MTWRRPSRRRGARVLEKLLVGKRTAALMDRGEEKGKVVDLMQALKKSLGEKKPAVRATSKAGARRKA